jgi:hypothetical protein
MPGAKWAARRAGKMLCRRCGKAMTIVRRQIFPSTTELPRVRHEDKSW